MNVITRFAAATSNTFIDPGTLPNPMTGNDEISKITTIIFTITSLIALIIIVIAGFRYIVARGDPNATAQARNTITYAVIGLVVVIAAYSIVMFVLKGIL